MKEMRGPAKMKHLSVSRGKKGQNGVSCLEFAMVLPVLLLILFAIVEYGWLMVHQIVLTNAVSAGARAAIRTKSNERAMDPDELAAGLAKNRTVDAFWVGTLTPDQVLANVFSDHPKRVQVSVPDWPYEPITNFLPSAFLPETLNAKAVMVFP